MELWKSQHTHQYHPFSRRYGGGNYAESFQASLRWRVAVCDTRLTKGAKEYKERPIMIILWKGEPKADNLFCGTESYNFLILGD